MESKWGFLILGVYIIVIGIGIMLTGQVATAKFGHSFTIIQDEKYLIGSVLVFSGLYIIYIVISYKNE